LVRASAVMLCTKSKMISGFLSSSPSTVQCSCRLRFGQPILTREAVTFLIRLGNNPRPCGLDTGNE
jgi:hypothetical protein